MRVLLKVAAWPLLLVLRIVAVLLHILTHVSAYVLSPLILFVLGCLIYSLAQTNWLNVGLLSLIEVMILAAMFGAAWIGFVIEDACDWLASL